MIDKLTKCFSLQEALKDFPGILWMDSSTEIQSSDLQAIYQAVQKTDGAMCLSATGHSTFAVTHPDMYRFLPTNVSAAKREEQWETVAFLYRTESLFKNVIFWWSLCALKETCITAGGLSHSKICLFNNGETHDKYVNCHRFDQSALNILLLNHYRLDSRQYFRRSRLLRVARGSSRHRARQCRRIMMPNLWYMNSLVHIKTGNKLLPLTLYKSRVHFLCYLKQLENDLSQYEKILHV